MRLAVCIALCSLPLFSQQQPIQVTPCRVGAEPANLPVCTTSHPNYLQGWTDSLRDATQVAIENRRIEMQQQYLDEIKRSHLADEAIRAGNLPPAGATPAHVAQSIQGTLQIDGAYISVGMADYAVRERLCATHDCSAGADGTGLLVRQRSPGHELLADVQFVGGRLAEAAAYRAASHDPEAVQMTRALIAVLRQLRVDQRPSDDIRLTSVDGAQTLRLLVAGKEIWFSVLDLELPDGHPQPLVEITEQIRSR